MSVFSKRVIPFIAVILLIVSCTATSPTTQPTELVINSPAASTLEQPAATSLPTHEPSTTSQPSISSGVILFSSNRSGVVLNLYLSDTSTGSVSQLTNGDSNIFPGPFSPNGKRLLFTGFGLTNSYVGLLNADGTDPIDLSGRPDCR